MHVFLLHGGFCLQRHACWRMNRSCRSLAWPMVASFTSRISDLRLDGLRSVKYTRFWYTGISVVQVSLVWALSGIRGHYEEHDNIDLGPFWLSFDCKCSCCRSFWLSMPVHCSCCRSFWLSMLGRWSSTCCFTVGLPYFMGRQPASPWHQSSGQHFCICCMLLFLK